MGYLFAMADLVQILHKESKLRRNRLFKINPLTNTTTTTFTLRLWDTQHPLETIDLWLIVEDPDGVIFAGYEPKFYALAICKKRSITMSTNPLLPMTPGSTGTGATTARPDSTRLF